MAKFRQNHVRGNKSGSFVIRGLLFAILLLGLLVFLFIKMNSANISNESEIISTQKAIENTSISNATNDIHFIDINKRHYLPNDNASQSIHHTYYSLGYNEEIEQANWVAYVLTKASLKVKNVKRERYFTPDYKVDTRSAFFRDYKDSGYTKGHLAPAGDMAFSKKAMKETFFMSNMCPQIRPFNNGIWKELEENIREWAYTKDELIIVTGPIYYDNQFDKIGQNRVGVPDAFYKILIDEKGDSNTAIAFIIPHQKTDLPLRDFATTINKVEEVTDINFFYRFFNDNTEEEVESNFDLKHWPINQKRYKSRVNSWNNEK